METFHTLGTAEFEALLYSNLTLDCRSAREVVERAAGHPVTVGTVDRARGALERMTRYNPPWVVRIGARAGGVYYRRSATETGGELPLLKALEAPAPNPAPTPPPAEPAKPTPATSEGGVRWVPFRKGMLLIDLDANRVVGAIRANHSWRVDNEQGDELYSGTAPSQEAARAMVGIALSGLQAPGSAP